MTVTPAIRRWRIALMTVGLAVLLLAATQLVAVVPVTRYLGIAAWLIGALIIHDGILAMIVVGASIVMRRLGRIPTGVMAIVQGALVVGGITALLVVPAAIKKAIGSANPSILPLDYLGNLALFQIGLARVTALAVGAYLTIRMLRPGRPRTY